MSAAVRTEPGRDLSQLTTLLDDCWILSDKGDSLSANGCRQEGDGYARSKKHGGCLHKSSLVIVG